MGCYHTVNPASPLPALCLRAGCSPNSREKEKETLVVKKRPYVGVGEAAGCGKVGSRTTMSPGLNRSAPPLTAVTPWTRSCPWCCKLWLSCCGEILMVVVVWISAVNIPVSSPLLPKVHCLHSKSSLHQEQGKHTGFSFNKTM